MKPCPCGSGQLFIKCCKPFITGKTIPSTAEQLMRSRYTAYTRNNVNYIAATQAAAAAEQFDRADTEQWMRSVKWQTLTVNNADNGGESDEDGTVDFTATFKFNGKLCKMHEHSRFKKIDGRWFYTGMVT